VGNKDKYSFSLNFLHMSTQFFLLVEIIEFTYSN